MNEAMNEKILQFLVRLGILTAEVANQVKAELKPQTDVIEYLASKGLLDEKKFLHLLETHFGIKTLESVEKKDLDEELLKKVPLEVLKKYKVLPLKVENGVLHVLTFNPFNTEAITTLKFILKAQRAIPVAVPVSVINQILGSLEEESESVVDEILSEFGEEEIEAEALEEEVDWNSVVRAAEEEAPIIKLVNAILAEGVKRGASDIHIEPQEKEVLVRYRIDGILRIFQRLPKRLKDPIAARIKIMANLDISERRKPQDGRIRIILQGRKIDFRVSTLPTIYGEKIVLRIQEAEKYLRFRLEDLGFEADNLFLFRHHIWQPWGMVLVTGPTGSGKTTTLYTALQERNTPEVNIMTAEDPVEVAIPGINQVQINEKVGLTFAAALKAFLRQDPDIILVGEIRDIETGEIAIKAALTGHLVFSTLHTNDAPSTITRLVDMGIEPFLVGTSLNLVVAQRLIRKLCPKCKIPAKEKYPPEFYRDLEEKVKNSIKRVIENLQTRLAKEKDPEKKKKIVEALGEYQKLLNGGLEIYTENPKGCDHCNNTGYKGRLAVHELLEMNEDIKNLVLKGANAQEIKLEAINHGMRTLYEDGLVKIGKGLTSIEEVKRVLIAD
jgi:type IV pilus assembly protein PilB